MLQHSAAGGHAATGAAVPSAVCVNVCVASELQGYQLCVRVCVLAGLNNFKGLFED